MFYFTLSLLTFIFFKRGVVNIAIAGTTTNDRTLLDIPRTSRRRSARRAHARRGLFDSIGKAFDSVKDAVGGAVDDVKQAASGVVDKVKDTAGEVVDKAKDVVTDVADAAGGECLLPSSVDLIIDRLQDANKIDKTFNNTLPPIDINKSFNIVNAAIDCGAVGKVSLKVDANTKAHADVNVGVVVAGTLVPPKFDTFSLTAGFNADLDGALTFVGSASGKPLSTGDINLFEVGIPGLDFPG
jgi:uncharacterized protein YjbJ (UPF0337 family)